MYPVEGANMLNFFLQVHDSSNAQFPLSYLFISIHWIYISSLTSVYGSSNSIDYLLGCAIYKHVWGSHKLPVKGEVLYEMCLLIK